MLGLKTYRHVPPQPGPIMLLNKNCVLYGSEIFIQPLRAFFSSAFCYCYLSCSTSVYTLASDSGLGFLFPLLSTGEVPSLTLLSLESVLCCKCTFLKSAVCLSEEMRTSPQRIELPRKLQYLIPLQKCVCTLSKLWTISGNYYMTVCQNTSSPKMTYPIFH